MAAFTGAVFSRTAVFSRGGRRQAPDTGSAGDGGEEHGGGLMWVVSAFVVAQLLLVAHGLGLGWDETVYVSQVGPQAPAAYFSAPRARGVSLLVAPVASWSTSTTLLRVYLALLSGLGLYLALRVWRGLLAPRTLALAAALFASLWVTVFYGPQAMPNYWVAVGALVTVGCFLRAQRDRHGRGDRHEQADRHGQAGRGGSAAEWGMAAGAALMALMRPTDAVWVCLPLGIALVGVRRWRSWRLLAALAGGLAAGAAQWIVEAYLHYGGPMARLAAGSRIQGGLGWHLAVDDQLRGLGGRPLCRPCTGPLPDVPLVAWWLAIPALAACAVVVALRRRRAAAPVLTLLCAGSAAVPYLFLIGYAAPRFLLPAYALLAVPIADVLSHLVGGASEARRPLVVLLVALGLAGHLAVQYAVLEDVVDRTDAAGSGYARAAAELHRLGVRPPCLLTGHDAIPIAYYAGCASGHTHGHNANMTRAAVIRAARHTPVAALAEQGGDPPGYAKHWRQHGLGPLTASVAPPR
ncbi:hypothetical protein [Streptomyces sp. NPDC087300]|uniref:hypothetical protein n=1 Tax=Streptomyces sp. NPDC087300 TaxID=3365780 RepID=UPI0038121851